MDEGSRNEAATLICQSRNATVVQHRPQCTGSRREGSRLRVRLSSLLGMLTLTQGLVLPTESLLQRRAAKVQKRNQFPTANGYLRDHCRKLGATRKFSESLTRPSRHQTPMSFKRAARSDLDAPISPLPSPVSRPCSLGCEARYPSPTSYCGAQLEPVPDTEIVARKRAQRPT